MIIKRIPEKGKIRDCEFEGIDSPVEFVDRAEDGLYMIIHRDERAVWDGGGWTKKLDDGVRYAPGEFPAQIESLQGLYILTSAGEIYGVPNEYQPPEEYMEENERGYAQGANYREPGEWLLDEYRDSLYLVREVRVIYQERQRRG